MGTLTIGNANWCGAYLVNAGTWLAGNFVAGGTGGTLSYGVAHFGELPEGNSYPTGDTVLTDATLTLTNANIGLLPFTGNLYVVTQRDSAPSAASYRRWQLALLTPISIPADGTYSFSLKTQQPGYGGTVRISDALQSAWRNRNLPYVDPYTGNSSPHMLTLVLTAADVALTHAVSVALADISLTVAEVPADYGQVGHQYVRSYDLGIGSGIVYDFKTGEVVAADEAITDGYYTGQLVRAENWDPRDRGSVWRRRLWPRTRLPRQSGGSR